MALVLTRPASIQGRPYRVGETLDTARLPSGKAQQLTAQRVVLDTTVSAPNACIALRTIRLGGRAYRRGDRVSMTGVAPGKIAQLLDHRILDLAPRV